VREGQHNTSQNGKAQHLLSRLDELVDLQAPSSTRGVASIPSTEAPGSGADAKAACDSTRVWDVRPPKKEKSEGATQPEGGSPQTSNVADVEGLFSYIAGCTARDHSVKVTIGTPGGGSFANLQAKHITLDPEHCENNGPFIAAHEGAHIGETPSLEQLGKSKREIREYSGQIGFFPLRNVLEDGAINDRFSMQYRELRACTLAAYPRVDATTPMGFINLPEVQQIATLLGRAPLYAQALAGLLSDWSELRHELGFGKPLEEYQQQPRRGGQCDHPAVERFFDITLNESRRAMSMIPSANGTGAESFMMGAMRFQWADTVIYPELKKLVDLDLRDLASMIQQRVGSGQQGQQSPEQQSGQPSAGGQPGGPQQGQQQGQEGRQGQRSEGSQQGGADENSEQDAGSGEQSDSRVDAREAGRRARELIAEVDDAIRRHLQSLKEKCEDEAPTTSEVVKGEVESEREAEGRQTAAAQEQEIARQLREGLRAALSPYHREYAEVSAAIEEAHNRLVDVFDPERHFKWRSKESSGQRIDTVEAMRFELTGQGHDKMWMRRIDPKYPDTDVIILIDRSGSMWEDNKYVPARRALIFAQELFARLNIRSACVGFGDTAHTFIDFDDDISEAHVQVRLMASTSPLDQGTRDASALRYTAALLKERNASHRAIIMLSDAESGQADELRSTVAALHADGIPVLHFGLGYGTTDEAKNYISSWGGLSLTDRGPNGFLAVFCREMERLAEEAIS
jgi:hypothetical protein